MAEPEKKKKKCFDDLTPELKGLIVDRVPRPSDLKNVCLVNKQFHEIAVKTLYRYIALDVGSANDKRLTAFLNPENIGLKYVKKIRLDMARVRDTCNQAQQAQLMCRMLLEFLPRDILEEFRCGDSTLGDPDWCPWVPFSADNLLLLYRRQRKIKWLEAMDVDRDILSEIKKDERLQETMFKEVRKLALYPENRATLDLAGYYISKTPHVEELILHANFLDASERRSTSRPSTDHIDTRELNDSATAPGLLTSTIFASMMPFDKCEPLKNLTVVQLHRVSVRFCDQTWCKLIDFRQVKELSIHSCTGADTLLSHLSKASSLPRNLETFEINHKDNLDNEALLALDGFLCLVSGIRELIIDLDNVKALPAPEGIARHHKTLTILCVHGSRGEYNRSDALSTSTDDGDQLVWGHEAFTKICKACTSLEQISCAWPATSLIRAPSTEWSTFLEGCRGLRNLVTLHTTTWPSNKPSSNLLPRMVYEQLLRALAQIMFSEVYNKRTLNPDGTALAADDPLSRNGKLRLVAFGINDKAFDREDSPNQIIYLRSTCVNADGATMVHAADISWCQRRYIEGRSDVLEYTLTERNIRPPCRESDMRGGHSWTRTGDIDDDDE